ncbi:MAG: hypothetical protein H7Y16_00560, partial [Candidatus Parcubacteria bacterium]|nr:hypothetical protein [Burkholderiales bacterium]
RVSITTNGKSDAMMNLTPGAAVGDDEPVMVMLAALPLLMHPEARSAAVIGIGSGISSHVLLASDSLRELDTIEIEPAMVEAARGFHPFNASVFSDSRSRIHIEDAKTFFSAHGRRYDIIVSEPSNPWVSGVASLFSEEFYRRIRRHLEPGGLFVQWLQLYEIEPLLVASVIKALALSFPNYVVYAPDDGNLIIVASEGAAVPAPLEVALRQPRLAAALARLQVRNVVDVEVMRVGSRRVLQPYFDRFPIGPNSDYFPVLDQNAARSRFMNAGAQEIAELSSMPIPAMEILGGEARQGAEVPSRPWLRRSALIHSAQKQLAYLMSGEESYLDGIPPGWRSDAQLFRHVLLECPSRGGVQTVDQLLTVAGRMLPVLSKHESAMLWQKLRDAPCPAAKLHAEWIAVLAAVDARDVRAMTLSAEPLLAPGRFAPGAHGDYLLAAAVLGRLALGDRKMALSLWHRYSPLAKSNPAGKLPEFIQAHLAAQVKN